MGIVVGDADNQRRDALDQVDGVNRKLQYAQDTCDDYKGKLEHAEVTNAAQEKVSRNFMHTVPTIFVHQ